MRKLFFIFSIVIFSCTQNVQKSKNLISEEKMIEVLKDIYIHQQPSYMTEMGGKPLDYARLNLSLLDKHDLKLEDFEKSYEYYILNPDIYEAMLVEIRTQLESQLPEEERIKKERLRKEAEQAAENN